MKKTTLWIVAILAVVTLAGCNKTPVENPEQNDEIANPASVYCEENGGTLEIETAEDGSQGGICLFDDGSYCEEWSYYRGECHAGEIIYNTVDEEVVEEAALYTQEDLAAAINIINNVVNSEWTVTVENFEATYAGDEVSRENLSYCQSLNADVTECAVFTSSFHIPEQETEMAGWFEPNTDMNDYSWYLGRTTGGEWTVLTNGLG